MLASLDAPAQGNLTPGGHGDAAGARRERPEMPQPQYPDRRPFRASRQRGAAGTFVRARPPHHDTGPNQRTPRPWPGWTRAMTRLGPPVAPATLGPPAMMVEPRGGNRSRLATFSIPQRLLPSQR